MPGRDGVSLLCVEIDGLKNGHVRGIWAFGKAEDFGQIKERGAVVGELIGLRDLPNRFADERFSLVDPALTGKDLRTRSPPDHLRHDVLGRGRTLAGRAELVGLAVALERVERPGEVCRGGREQRLLAHLLEPLVGGAHEVLGSREIPRQRLDEDLMERRRRVHPADVVEDRVSLADERACVVELSPHCVESSEGECRHADGDRVGAHLLEDRGARFDRRPHGSRSVERGGCPPGQDLEQRPFVTVGLGVGGGALPGLVCPCDTTLIPLDPGSQ